MVTFDVMNPIFDDEESHGNGDKYEEDIPLKIRCLGIATVLKYVPSQEVHKEGEESEISIEIPSDSLPFVPEETGYNWMFQ